MADQFQIIPYKVRSAGTDVPPEEIQTAINLLALQTTIALNSVASDPTGPAGGDLGGTYPNPTVVKLHVTSGTESGVAITASTVDSTPVGATAPSTGAFTTLTATTPVGVASGGTGHNTLSAHNVLIGEGTAVVGFAAPSTAGGMLISQGAAVDPAFGNNPTITGGSVDGAPVGATTPSTGAFTTLAASGAVSGAGFTARFASPGPIGNTAASTGAFTTIIATSTITPSSTNGIVGTTTNDNANAGSVGEYVESAYSAFSFTNATVQNLTSISLTAGDWDVEGFCSFASGTGTTITNELLGINTTSATLPAVGRYSRQAVSVPSTAVQSGFAPTTRISVASTTTVFLVGEALFAGGTATGDGFIRARRIR